MSTVDITRAADLMQASRATVEELINSCALRAAKIGKKWVLLERDVLDYIERQIVAQTADRMRRPAAVDSRGRSRATV